MQQLVTALKDLLSQRDQASTTFQALLDLVGQNSAVVCSPNHPALTRMRSRFAEESGDDKETDSAALTGVEETSLASLMRCCSRRV